MEKRQLIREQDVVKAAGLDKINLPKAAGLLMKMTGVHRINQIYEDLKDIQGLDFVEKALQNLQITHRLSEEDLQKIPEKGPFIVVANHPFGLLDGLIMARLIGQRRPDFKVMANFLLSEITNISEFFIPVNPFDSKNKHSNIGGFKQSLQQIKNGGGLCIFPAGEVSTWQNDGQSFRSADRKWSKSVLKLIKKAEVPVIPMCFEGENSRTFHLLGLIHPALRTARLPAEFFKKSGTEIKVHIGRAISVKEQAKFEDIERFGRYLRARTYAQKNPPASGLKSFFKNPFQKVLKPKDIIEPPAGSLLKKEISRLKPLLVQQNMEVYAAESGQIPFILQEIGRLREVAFRLVGEGSGKNCDLDEYDLYYSHLFVWDKEAEQIAGAYRIGKGKMILSTYGKKGFYIRSLFKIKNDFIPILGKSFELGRSFVAPVYQKKRLPLFLLWQGILSLVAQSDDCQYLIGPVSISNDYSELSRSVMVAFIKNKYYEPAYARFVKARKDFKFKITEENSIFLEASEDLKNLDQLIGSIENRHFGAPVLVKKYLNLNAKIIGFNLDPKFNDALDGLILLDITQIPSETLKNLKSGSGI